MKHISKSLIVKSTIIVILIGILSYMIYVWRDDWRKDATPIQQKTTTTNVFEYYIRLEEDVPKQIKNEINRLLLLDWKVTDITSIPEYTEAIVYDERGDISHTIQWVLGYDIFIIAKKEIRYEPSQTL